MSSNRDASIPCAHAGAGKSDYNATFGRKMGIGLGMMLQDRRYDGLRSIYMAMVRTTERIKLPPFTATRLIAQG